MKHKCHVPTVTYSPTLTNYTCGVVLVKSLSGNNFLNYHVERSIEKTFKSLKNNHMVKTTLFTF